jgi:hypothetical protein
MDCACGGQTKPLRRVGPRPGTAWRIEQCVACGREERRLAEAAPEDDVPTDDAPLTTQGLLL